LRREILKLKDERAKYRKLIKKVLANLIQYRKQLADDKKQIIDLTKTRAEDHADFKRSQAEHIDIINAIDAVVTELRKLVGSISGKGKPKHVGEIAEETRDRTFKLAQVSEETKSKLAKSFLEITKDDQETSEFLQMATEADQASLHKLIGLLLKLKSSAEKSFNHDKRAERKSKATFKRLIAIIKKDIEKLGAMIVTSEKNLKTYRDKVAKLTIEINIKTKLRANKIKEREETIKERELKEKQYEEEKRQRADEIAIVEKLQKIVKTRLANMTKYLKDNTGS